MKKNILIIITGLLVFMSSCSKDFLNVNEKNPNSPSVVDPALVLPAAQNLLAFTMNNPRYFEFVYLWHGLWSISAGYSQPQSLTQYKLTNGSYQNPFIQFYTAAKNLDVIEQQSKADTKDVYYQAIAKILKAYIFQNLVDCWGDVPYTEAFQTGTGNLKPKFDKQQAIYEDLVVQLDAAIALINSATGQVKVPSATSDIFFGGKPDQMGLWLRFANTIKLRILIHQADMAGRTDYIKGKIATTAAIGYLGAGESALSNPPYVVSSGKMNPFYETFYNNAGTSQSDGITYYFAGTDAIEYMKSSNDPRLGKFFNPYTGSSFAGNIFGTPSDLLITQNVTSKLGYITGDAGTMIGTPTKAAPILTDMESLFIQAEASERGLITGDAQVLYESAVTRSFAYMGLTSAAASAYLSQTTAKANYTTASIKRELIIAQKWISLNGIAPVEIWTDYRRTGFPDKSISATGLHFSTEPARSKDYPPVRLLYPQDEINVNNENVLAVGPIDPWTSKIFWQNR